MATTAPTASRQNSQKLNEWRHFERSLLDSPILKASLDDMIRSKKGFKIPLWAPIPFSPQEAAYHSDADELFFGGAAGGGKTELLIGLALTSHRNSIIFRREFPQLRAIIERSRQLIGKRGRYNANEKVWRLDDNRVLELGAVQHEENMQKYQGRPHSLKCFDELPHFSRQQYRFLIGWNRTEDIKERCRVVSAGNPPTTPEGRWVVEEWAPWLDGEFHDPAAPGELRWYAVLDGKTVWLRSGEKFTHRNAESGKEELIEPRSRTFIPARVQDNPYYMETGYTAVLQSMPEPLRSQMLYGDFMAGTQDDAYQVIPTLWIRKAQERWKADGRVDALSCVGVDVARGGECKTVLSRRYGRWFAPLDKHPGKYTPDGPAVSALVLQAITDNPKAVVNVDVIGVGASVFDHLRLQAKLENPVPVNFAEHTGRKDRTGVLEFVNYRAYAYWSLREALDPDKGDNLALPPDQELLSDLAAPHWSMGPGGIVIERKEDIVKRIGRSPDCGDAMVLAWLQKRRPANIY